MRATLSKNKDFISIAPKPTEDIRDGLKVYYTRDIDEDKAVDLPIATAYIIKGKMRYYLPKDLGIIEILRIELCKQQ